MDHFAKSSNNMFSVSGLNRAHNRRKRPDWLRERFDDPDSVFVPVWLSKVLISNGNEPRPVLLKRNEVESNLLNGEEVFFLGEENGQGFFAVEVKTIDDVPPPDLASHGIFRDLRAAAPLLSLKDSSLLAYAKVLVYWHGRNRFCSVCGSPSRSGEGGHVRICSSLECLAPHFPRTDPAIIMLIHCGNRCLLGRQPIWPERRYSVLAGFVEPGESAEAAVIREAFEEAGVRVNNIYYHSSQPWPFPSSLMLGFTAEAEDEQINLGDKELVDARWFSPVELKEAVENGSVLLPPPISVAFHLLADWFNGQTSISLSELAVGSLIVNRRESKG